MTSDLMRQVTDPANRHDPYPLYAELRRRRVNLLGDGSYALGRYQDVAALLHDPRIGSDPHDLSDPGSAEPMDAAPFIQRDPARPRPAARHRHALPRSPGQPRGGQRPGTGDRAIRGRLADALPRSGQADLVCQFAYPLPVSVICGLLGVPTEDEPQFRGWTEDMAKGMDAQDQQGADDLIRLRQQSEVAMFVYVTDLLKQHRAHPGGSMLSRLANDDTPTR
jgi:cytochrome P450